MKTLTLILSLLLTVSAIAQSVDSTTSLDSTFSETKQLTDQQNDEAQKFVHKGLEDAAIKKGCADKLLKGCDPGGADTMGVLLGGGIENQIGKFYALIFGIMPMMNRGGGAAASSTAAPAAEGAANAGANAGANGAANGAASSSTSTAAKPKKDYCIYIPIGYEVIAMMTQMGGQKQAQQDTANLDPQLAALAQLKEAHKTRKKTATFQSVIYGSTAACYAAMMFIPPGSTDTMTIVKMGAAGALSALFMAKAAKHGKAAQKIQEVIDSLPKAGDCNPWTGTSCFCAEKTSATLYQGQYNEVCVLNKGNPNGTLSNMGCAVSVAGKVSLDATCSCKAKNTCLSSRISLSGGSLGLGANFVNDANKGLALLDPSQFDEAKLAAFQSNMAAKLGNVKVNGTIPDVKLTPQQKSLADEMANYAPAAIANLAAASPSAAPPSGGIMAGATTSGLDKIPASLKKSLGDFEVAGQYRRNGGSGVSNTGSPEVAFSMPGMGGPQEPQGGTEVEEFAAKAISQADIRNSPETGIFDIISNRYRSSAWKKLDTEGK